jgi:hypothetical protein
MTMTGAADPYRKRLAGIGALCGLVVGYLKAKWVVAGSYLLLFLLCGGDSMKNMNIFFLLVALTFLVAILIFVLIGAYIGYIAGKFVGSPARLAAGGAVFLLFTGLIWKTNLTPAQSERSMVEAMRARYYGTDGYKKVVDAALRPSADGSCLELSVKTDGRRSGSYTLTRAMIQYYEGAEAKDGTGSTGLFYEQTRMELPKGPDETTVTIPFSAISAKYKSSRLIFSNKRPSKTTVEVYLVAGVPATSEYYAWEERIAEKKVLDVSLAAYGIGAP